MEYFAKLINLFVGSFGGFEIANFEFVIRLFIALILGVVIGTERVYAHKTAGMRTYALVSMGSALFVIISEEIVQEYLGFSGINPLILASQVVVGVGFIGSGLIFTKDNKSVGLTTATGLWVSAGIGMAAGFGLFNIAIISTILLVFVFVVLWILEQQFKKTKFFKESQVDNN